MPFVNGKFYASLLYGRALERARAANEGRVWSEEQPEMELLVAHPNQSKSGSQRSSGASNAHSKRRAETRRPADNPPQYDNPQNEKEARLANVIHNETGSLRDDPHATEGHSGSSEDLQNARLALAEVANRAITSGHPQWVAPSELSSSEAKALSNGNADAIRAHNASLAAARAALAGSNSSMGATQYRLRPHHDARTPIDGSPITDHFGPFPDTLGKSRTIVIAH